ncbi:MAG: hypothetical protein JSW51_10630 [Gemmatimonadota bacterium]|nr:MAG: hypothetical protein JSW51_10630 [Gemmatimonadota bacterium]
MAAAFLFAVLCSLPASLKAQEDLGQAIEMAQQSWLSHNMSALVAGSDTVRLRIPGIAPSASLRPGQASRLLEQYVKSAEEISCERTGLRELSDDHVYAEVQRVYVVQGTDQQRTETILFGFRRIDGMWRLREVRVTP